MSTTITAAPEVPVAPARSGDEMLLAAGQAGDQHAVDLLLRRYEPMIRMIVASMRLPGRCERADIAQEGRIALVCAIRAWRPTRGPFRPFAAHCVRSKTLNALDTAGARKHQVLNRAVSFDGVPAVAPSVGAYDGPPLLPSDPEVSPHTDPVIRLLLRERLADIRDAWPALTAKERASLAGILSGKSYRQVANELGCTPKAVGRAVSRGRHKLAVSRAALG